MTLSQSPDRTRQRGAVLLLSLYFILHLSWRRVFEATHEFIDRYLQPGT